MKNPAFPRLVTAGCSSKGPNPFERAKNESIQLAVGDPHDP
jgi:hypothetical protein